MADKLRAQGSIVGQTLTLPRWVDAVSLTAGAAESWTVPTLTGYVIMTGTAGFFVNTVTTATVPGDTTNGTASFYVPAALEAVVDTGDVISFISSSNAVITIACYRD